MILLHQTMKEEMMGKAGPKPLPPGEKKSMILAIRVSSREHEIIRRNAEAAGMQVSEFGRGLMLSTVDSF